MTTLTTETQSLEQVLDHHLQAFIENDIEELLKDYTGQSEVWTPQGAVIGLEKIASFFAYVFTLLPKDSTRLEVIQKIVKDEKAYIAWSADSVVISIFMAADCFEIKEGKILWQSTGAHIIHK